MEKEISKVSSSVYSKGATYIHGDTFKAIKKLESNKFSLIITSPPYNLGKEYESSDSFDKYLENYKNLISEFYRILKPTGSICWQVGNYIEKGEVFPLDIFYYPIFKEKGFSLRNRIIWHFEHGLHSTKRFSGRYETILWFTKSKEYTFNLDDIRVASKYPAKRHFKGPKKGELSGNPLGKNPSDVWQILLQDWEAEIWNIPNVKANHKEKTVHPCQYPIELVERCILALTNIDDWILDPFAGVGSTLLAAIKQDRNSIGIEKYKKYIKIGLNRIEELQQGKLIFRAMNQTIYDHTKSNLSKLPEEFKKHENL